MQVQQQQQHTQHHRLVGDNGGPHHTRNLGRIPHLDLSQLDMSSGFPDSSFQSLGAGQYAHGNSLSARTPAAHSYTSRASSPYQAHTMYTPRQGPQSARGSSRSYGRQYYSHHTQSWTPDSAGGRVAGLEKDVAVPAVRVAVCSPSDGMSALEQESWLSARGVRRGDPYEEFLLHSPRSLSSKHMWS